MTASEPTTCEACGLSHERTPEKDLEAHGWWRWNTYTDEWDVRDFDALIRALEEQVHTQDEAWGRDAKAWLAEKEALEKERAPETTCRTEMMDDSRNLGETVLWCYTHRRDANECIRALEERNKDLALLLAEAVEIMDRLTWDSRNEFFKVRAERALGGK